MPEAANRSRPLSEDFADAAVEMAALLSTKRAYRAVALPPAVSDLVYRGLRAWGLAQVRLARMAKKSPPTEIAALLAIAWAALDDQLRAAHVIVDEAVSAAKKIAARSLRLGAGRHQAPSPMPGFVNALLRKVIADPAAAESDRHHPEAAWNAPAWWIDRIHRDWGERAPSMLTALCGKGRLTVRVSVSPGHTVADYLEELSAAGLRGIQVGPQAVVIEPARPVSEIPGFKEGRVSVQDAAAQHVCRVFDDLANRQRWGGPAPVHILDACAAPGGKSIALAQAYPATVWAMDVSADRLGALRRDLPRVSTTLQGEVNPIVADVLAPESWPKELPLLFDAILVDAPCSASGVTRRHPEIPWRRSPGGIDDVVDIQRRMLDLLWGRLKPGGELAFVTCSVFCDEGEHQRQWFLARTPDAHSQPCAGRVWPGDDLTSGLSQDGFFFALFQKQNATRDPLPASDAHRNAAAQSGISAGQR